MPWRDVGLQDTNILAVLKWEKSESVLGKCLTDPTPFILIQAGLPKPLCSVSFPDQELPEASNTICGPNYGFCFSGLSNVQV